MSNNTKLQILQSYSNTRIRDSWQSLGGLQCTATTRFYIKDQIYQISDVTSPLNGSLVFCQQEHAGIVTWSTVVIEDSDRGELTFADNIISPNFILLLLKADLDVIADPIDATWQPFTTADVEATSTQGVIIPDNELDIIMTDLGVPFISYDELEYSKADILDKMIKPAIEEYFKWFPKVEIVTYPGNTTALMEYEFPTNAYDVIHVGINQNITGMGGTTNTLLRYFDEVIWTAGSPAPGMYAGAGTSKPRSRMYDWGSMMMDRSVRQAMLNYGTRVHHTVVTRNGKKYVQLSTNKVGVAQVHFAIKSLDWADVEFARLPELRKLAQAKVLKAFASLRTQARADIPGAVDYSEWLTRAETYTREVTENWQNLVKFSGVLRGSH